MGSKTSIEWTDATWNPVTGCTRVSAGCDNCYAEELARWRLKDTYLKQAPVLDTPEAKEDPFSVRLWPQRMEEPLRWRARKKVFVNSMSDTFHKDVPEPFLRELFELMVDESRHVYQVLTKRPARAIRFFERNPDLMVDGMLPHHIWIGTTIESQDTAFREDHLTQIPARVRFISCEPLIGPVRLKLEPAEVHWVIAGGESGKNRRTMELDWARSLRDQSVRANVPFFFKQVGGYTPKAGGRTLDGETWNQEPGIPDWTATPGPVHWEIALVRRQSELMREQVA